MTFEQPGPEPGVVYRRPWTGPVRRAGTTATTITTKRACNGCGRLIGDGTVEEIAEVMGGGSWPDVRAECPWCVPDQPVAVDQLDEGDSGSG